ncbi:hypothetical protein B0H14DRAFT_3508708 [Mycena olivaceomarginata]|nr:hypothetical protein B0H14DRAFT_3508708 [Mycena olivaceomarginata]
MDLTLAQQARKVLDPLQQKLERLPDPSGKIAAAKARVGAMQSILPAKKQRRAFDNTPLAYLGIDQEFLLFNAAQIAKLLAAPRATTEQMQQLCARIARIDRRVGDDARFYSLLQTVAEAFDTPDQRPVAILPGIRVDTTGDGTRLMNPATSFEI